jgi:hypothetical protein
MVASKPEIIESEKGLHKLYSKHHYPQNLFDVLNNKCPEKIQFEL